MRNEEGCFFAGAVAAASGAAGRARDSPRSQRRRRGRARMRSYRDVRASFEPWRRVALLAWADRDATPAMN